MTTWSKTYKGEGGRSNARRAARAAGVDPELVDETGDGFRFPLPADKADKPKREKPAKAPAPFVPDFRFTSRTDAQEAGFAAERRAGLKQGAMAVVAKNASVGTLYAYVPAHVVAEQGLTLARDYNPPAPQERTSKPDKAGKRRSKGKARKAGGNTSDTGGAKGEQVLAMILNPKGATMPEIMAATGWLGHTARARISGLVAKHGLTIRRDRLLGVTTYYATRKAKAA